MKLSFLDNYDFFTGVPDSQLKPLSDYLISTYGISSKHIIAANEGNAVALAAGYHLATSKVPVVYMQNSGIGNVINPVASLMNDRVYGIPCIFIVGWRGEPGTRDEPQHIFQGEITAQLLEEMDIRTMVIGKETTEGEAREQLGRWQPLLDAGKQVAFIIRKGALQFDGKVEYNNHHIMMREDIIRHIVAMTRSDPIVSTTGKASRELFEIRASRGETHEHDFLTVGAMGHSSSIALGIALQRPEKRVWIIDGDGALLMHMGSMAVMGANKPPNVVHIVINNSAHETVGGMPTVAGSIDIVGVAKACGYPNTVSVNNLAALDEALRTTRERNELSLIEARCSLGAREDLGRPTTTAKENKVRFIKALAD
mgnify:CR=1 FL=1